MPKAASKKQYRFMMAILHGDGGSSKRGDKPPKSVAGKYSSPGKSSPESKGKEYDGGKWDEKNKSKDKSRVESKRTEKKKNRAKSRENKVKKSFEEFYRKQGAGVIVANDKGQVLLGRDRDSFLWQTPGGHLDEGEDFIQAAIRETEEETGLIVHNLHEIAHYNDGQYDSKTYFTNNYSGVPKDTDELTDLKFFDLKDALGKILRACSRQGLEDYAKSALKKSTKIKDMTLLEELNKNVVRGNFGGAPVFDVTHGDALRLVGNGCFRMLKRAVDDMHDEDFRDVHIDTYTISIRKHINDVYSGRVSDGHKTIHQFTNKSLPQLCADIMSLFEWYSDEDEHVFDILDEQNLPDNAIHGGLSTLADNYKKNNLANIYTEMNNIREEVRNGMAVDLQQVEHRIMDLFDRLEDTIHDVAGKHNELAQEAGKEIEVLESKLRELQSKLDEMNSKPTTVNAYQSNPTNPNKIYDNHYMYLPKPKITIEQNGQVSITFNEDWTDMEKSNFLNDMKVKILKKRS